MGGRGTGAVVEFAPFWITCTAAPTRSAHAVQTLPDTIATKVEGGPFRTVAPGYPFFARFCPSDGAKSATPPLVGAPKRTQSAVTLSSGHAMSGAARKKLVNYYEWLASYAHLNTP